MLVLVCINFGKRYGALGCILVGVVRGFPFLPGCHRSSAGIILNEPRKQQKFSLSFLMTFFVITHLQQVYLFGPVYLALSGVTRPLHQHVKPFTKMGPILPPTAPPPWSWGFGDGLCRLCTGVWGDTLGIF